MGWTTPFSFRGSIGRGQLWATLLPAGAVELAASAIPVTRHHMVLSTYGGSGESYVDYATPAEPVTWLSWAFFAAFTVIMVAVFWATAAAMVKRLHDVGRSGKWVAIVFGGLALSTAIAAAPSLSNAPAPIANIASIVVLIPTCLLGVFGLFQMMVVGGETGHRQELPEGDLRRLPR